MTNHPKQVQNDYCANLSKIGTKTAMFKSYVTLSSLSLGVKLGTFSKGRQKAWPKNLMIMCYKKPVIFFIFDIYYAA